MEDRRFKPQSFCEISRQVKNELVEAGYDLEMLKNDLSFCFFPDADAEEVRKHDMEEYRKSVDPDADEWEKIARGYEQIPSGTLWLMW